MEINKLQRLVPRVGPPRLGHEERRALDGMPRLPWRMSHTHLTLLTPNMGGLRTSTALRRGGVGRGVVASVVPQQGLQAGQSQPPLDPALPPCASASQAMGFAGDIHGIHDIARALHANSRCHGGVG